MSRNTVTVILFLVFIAAGLGYLRWRNATTISTAPVVMPSPITDTTVMVSPTPASAATSSAVPQVDPLIAARVEKEMASMSARTKVLVLLNYPLPVSAIASTSALQAKVNEAFVSNMTLSLPASSSASAASAAANLASAWQQAIVSGQVPVAIDPQVPWLLVSRALTTVTNWLSKDVAMSAQVDTYIRVLLEKFYAHAQQ